MVFNNLHGYPISRQKHKHIAIGLHVLMTPLTKHFVTSFEQKIWVVNLFVHKTNEICVSITMLKKKPHATIDYHVGKIIITCN